MCSFNFFYKITKFALQSESLGVTPTGVPDSSPHSSGGFSRQRRGQAPRTDTLVYYLMLHSISLKTLIKRGTSRGFGKNPSTP